MNLYCNFKSKNRCFHKILGIKLYDKKIINNEETIKILYNFLKFTNTVSRKKVYFFGITIFSKEHVIKSNEINTDILRQIIRQELKTITNTLGQKILDETRAANAVSTLHSKVFPKFKNENKGKDVVIVGTGPTLNCYKQMKKAKHIGLNKAFKCKKIKLDYMFAIDYSSVKDFIKEIKNYNCVKFLGMHANMALRMVSSTTGRTVHIPEALVDEVGGIRFYSDAHRKKIYQNIEAFPLMDKGSVAFPAIHFALYTQPKRLFLVGCDTSLTGYYDKKDDNSTWGLLGMALKGYKEVKQFCEIYYPDTEIISVNPVGLKGLFNDVYTRKYVKENPELFENINEIKYLEDLIKESINA